MKLLLTITFSLTLIFCNAQKYSEQEFTNLKTELKQILESDQELRELFDTETLDVRKEEIYKKYNITKEQFERENWMIVQKYDSINIKKIDKIISKYGYPGKSLVGEPENTSAFYVIQHSNKIKNYFPLIKKAGKKNELPKTLVAMMEDRLLVQEGKEQIYGTQGSGFNTKNGWTMIIHPIKNPEKVNKLRKKVGFTETVEENAKRLGIDYKVLTLEDVKKLKENK
jgi:hypothetical protein